MLRRLGWAGKKPPMGLARRNAAFSRYVFATLCFTTGGTWLTHWRVDYSKSVFNSSSVGCGFCCFLYSVSWLRVDNTKTKILRSRWVTVHIVKVYKQSLGITRGKPVRPCSEIKFGCECSVVAFYESNAVKTSLLHMLSISGFFLGIFLLLWEHTFGSLLEFLQHKSRNFHMSVSF